jgi:TetR/AcrR family transcriptional repressor of nem operon
MLGELTRIDDRSTMIRKTSITRETLIDAGLKALLTNGYDGVGLAEILGAAGVPKGSFYHFFRSKEDFANAVLDAYEQHYIALRRSILEDGDRSPLDRLRAYFDELERIHLAEKPLGGCLYGVLAQTSATRSSEFRARIAPVFAFWEAQFERVLIEAQVAGEVDPQLDPKAAAAFLIEAYEGALIRMKVEGGSAGFNRLRTFALGSISSKGRSEST